MKRKFVPPGFPLCECGATMWKTKIKHKLYECRVCGKERVDENKD